ncbi:hypothetical protein B0J18DRAFT_242087 [Chaetomium sp. MPI-SDFR-AT-0129]|nr:hypothetical protein B0J18DRAFT_242087 [Chaetomium sp. MPI-SDFR-AT-0129]
MAGQGIAKSVGIWAGGLLLGLSLPYLPKIAAPDLATFIGDFPIPDYPFALPFLKNSPNATTSTPEEVPFVCDTTHTYRTELVSLDPLIIYIHDLLTQTEIDALLKTAEPKFVRSQVSKYGRQQATSDRTSSSAGLPRTDPAVMCVLNRTRTFMGTMLRDGWDEMGPPQLVRYGEGEKFNMHHDWYNVPQQSGDDRLRKWNRVASFFAILEDACTGGETYFPFAKPITLPSPNGERMWGGDVKPLVTEGGGSDVEGAEVAVAQPLWREHEDGGLAFRPVASNAIFWVNLHPNATGDVRTHHAGLPLKSGRKTAMNIWPRQYYPYE